MPHHHDASDEATGKIEPGTTDDLVGHSQAEQRAAPHAGDLPDEGPAPGELNEQEEWRPSDQAEEQPGRWDEASG